jgi:bacillithiol synthase
VSMRVVTTPPGGSSLTRLAIEGVDVPWFVKRPRSAWEWKQRAELARENVLSPRWATDLAPAIEARGRAAERLARAESSGIAVTTGQQPGLFGGPLYTWWKALSALSLAERLEEITGIPVVPVFWAATDDSDFAEASYTVVQTNAGAERIEMQGGAPEGTRMSDVPLGDLSAQMSQLAEAFGSSASSRVLDIVKRAYAPGRSVGGAYLELLRELLEPLGIPVLDAAHPVVRAASHPLLLKALEREREVEDALVRRSGDLKDAGHQMQVKLVPGRTLVFADNGGRRDRVRSRDAAEAITTGAPGTLGPNVLLRPIVERSIIPTVAYVGGPAEIAYFAQTTAVADALGVPAPLVVPRWSGMVIEPRIEKILERHHLTVEDFRDPHEVETRIARASLPDDLRGNIASLKEVVKNTTKKIADSDAATLVPKSVLDGLERSVSHRVDRLERRFTASVKNKGNEALKDVAVARGALFPLGVPQERALNILPMLARHGDDLLSAVLNETGKHAAEIAEY